ncbi:P-loop containing nucleoside triphosphate hydrolase protein [Tuber brumale]|nr:P-loop containing nucleoside triphosphate hydrolase protein [Tuber brumale]
MPPPRTRQIRRDEVDEKGKPRGPFEMDGSPLRPGGQTKGTHQGTQAESRGGVREMPPTADPKYTPHPPPVPDQQVYTTLPEVSPNEEIIIALMGVTGKVQMTGAGKSFFIREVSGNSEVVVSDDLYSCTSKVQSYSFGFEGAKITLVDTPGFDDTNRSDTEILQEIADWTTRTYREKQLLSGIIYLHPITHTRMEGSAVRNLRMFRNLCGQEVLKNVLLTTTQWSNVDPAEGEYRESNLRNGDFWGGLVDKGATIQRFHGTRESGLELIRGLMSKERKPLGIQVQIVNQNMSLPETDAGKYIKEELIVQEKKHKEEMESLKRACEEAIKAMADEITELRAAAEKVQKKYEKVLAEKRLLAELHAAEVEKREMREEAENRDKAIIAVATKDLKIIPSGVTSYNTRGRLISDVSNDEQFKSNPVWITICSQSNNPNVQAPTRTFPGTSDAGIDATSYIALGEVRYQRRPGTHRTSGGKSFIIFSKTSDGEM